MKYFLMMLTGFPVTLMFRLMRPFRPIWRRIYYTARLKADLGDLDFSVQCDGPVHVTGTGRVRLGRRCRLGMDVELQANSNGTIRIGDDVRINRGTTISADVAIEIGATTLIGEWVSIRDANHGMRPETAIRFQPQTAAPVTIGPDVWIGRGACILAGVTIGQGAVIGANSVVTKDIPPRVIAAGAPAKVIKDRI